MDDYASLHGEGDRHGLPPILLEPRRLGLACFRNKKNLTKSLKQKADNMIMYLPKFAQYIY